MRSVLAWGVLTCLVVHAAPGQAQRLGSSVVGHTYAQLAHGKTGWCSIGRGASEFRDVTPNQSLISISELIYFDGKSYYQLSGQAKLQFSSGSSGTIAFQSNSAAEQPISLRFVDFAETKGDQQKIAFSVLFPDGCALPVAAVYPLH